MQRTKRNVQFKHFQGRSRHYTPPALYSPKGRFVSFILLILFVCFDNSIESNKAMLDLPSLFQVLFSFANLFKFHVVSREAYLLNEGNAF